MPRFLRVWLLVLCACVALSSARSTLAQRPTSPVDRYQRERWGPSLTTLYDAAMRNDQAALLELQRRAADHERNGKVSGISAAPSEVFGEAITQLTARAASDPAARASLMATVPNMGPKDHHVALMLTAVATNIAAQPTLSKQDLVDLAIVIAHDRTPGGVNREQGERAKKAVGEALASGNADVRRALGGGLRGGNSRFSDTASVLTKYYEEADPKTFIDEDWTNIALLSTASGHNPHSPTKMQTILRDGLRSNAPGARQATRDLLLDRTPGLFNTMINRDNDHARGDLARALVETTPKKVVEYNQGATHFDDGKVKVSVHDFNIDDEAALASVVGRLGEFDGKAVREALDGWKRPAAYEFDRAVEREFNPHVKAYTDAKRSSAQTQFDALNAKIRAAGAHGEISQADAEGFRRELFDLAARVAMENQSGAVKSGNKVITPGFLIDTIVQKSAEEHALWGGPQTYTGLGAARGMLADLDRFTLQQIQESAGLILSKDERIALEDSIITSNQAAIREQMVKQMELLSRVMDKVAAPAKNRPSGPITVLQDFLKYEIGSENSYVAMVGRLLPIYKDFGPMYDLIPPRGKPITPEAYRDFMAKREALLERIRGADESVAKYIESQKEWKDGITSIGAVAAATALAIPTGGQSLWITVPVFAGAGATTKIGLSWGDDYLGGRDYSLRDGVKDGVFGAVDGVSVLVGGSLSTAARNAVGKRIGIGLLEKGLQRELNVAGATLMQRFLVHGVTTTSRGATFGAMTGFTRKTYDVVERINSGRESFGLHTLGEIAGATALSAGSGAVFDFGLTSVFSGLGKMLPKRPGTAINPQEEGLLWRLLGSEKPADLASANALLKAKFPRGFDGGGVLSQEQTLALEAYARLVAGKGWVGDAAALKLEVLAPKISPSETLAIGDTLAPNPNVFRSGNAVRVPRSSGAIDEGWRIDAINPDGSIRVVGPGGINKAMSPQGVLEHNPELLRGLRVRTTRSSGAVEDNWFVDGMEQGRVRLSQPSSGLRRYISPSELRSFIAQNADTWSPAGGARLLPEQLPNALAKAPEGVPRQVSEAYRSGHRVEGNQRIPDGFVDGGRGMNVAADGAVTSPREVLVIDRARDPILQRQLGFARELGDRVKAGKVGEEQAYRELAQYVDRSMSPSGDRDLARSAMERWLPQVEGREILIGDVTRLEAGMCRHRSLLFKVLGDELGDAAGRPGKVALVRGNYVGSGGSGGHAWNELTLPSGQRVIVDVMNPSAGFRFPSLAERAQSYVRTDNTPFYGATNAPSANASGQTMIFSARDLAEDRARAFADALQKRPVGGLTTREQVWSAIREAQEAGVGDLYRAEIQSTLMKQLEAIERIKGLPGRGPEATAELANVSMRARAAGFGVDDLQALLTQQQAAAAQLKASVDRAAHAGAKEYPKHFVGKNDVDAARLSKPKKPGDDAVGQFLPSRFGPDGPGNAARRELERAALLDPRAVRVENGGAVHVYWEASEVVGFSNGQPTRWMRVELSGNTVHSHPRLPDLMPQPVKDQLRVRAILDDRTTTPSVVGSRGIRVCDMTIAPPGP